MRFIVMHKLGTKEPENFPPPPPELMKSMGELVGEAFRTGKMENGAGLNPRFPRTRLSVNGGTVVERHGPLDGTNELVARMAMITTNTKAEAIDVGKRFAKAIGGDVTLEVGRVTEPWDIGMVPVPTTPQPEKYLLLHMADARHEAGTPLADDAVKHLETFIIDEKKSGVLQACEAVRPSREGRRLKFKSGSRTTVIDGPFAETKELVSGFCLLKLDSLEDALAWATRYGAILQDLEVDVLRLPDVSTPF